MSFVDEEFEEETEQEQVQAQSPGKGLRAQLEKLLEENRQLSSRLKVFEARQFIEQHGFSGVKPEQLVEVPSDQWEERAKALHEEYVQLRREVAAEILRSQGITDAEDLEEALKAVVPSGGNDDAEARRRLRQTASNTAGPAPVVDTSNLSPMDLIRSGLAKKH
jgi:hypothetical protein